MERASLEDQEFYILLLRLLKYVKIIPIEMTANCCSEAYEIIGRIDENDAIFIATALAFKCPVWSDDKHFKKQDKVRVFTTKEIMNSPR